MKLVTPRKMLVSAIIAASAVNIQNALASSHREAPFITEIPKVDGTDFYMFRSYEKTRENFTTIIANYLPLQAAYGGPNYFDLANNALYEIHIDQDGDAVEDMTFTFRFEDIVQNLAVDVNGVQVAVPLKNIGAIGPSAGDVSALNARQTYSLTLTTGDRRTGSKQSITNADSGAKVFAKPADFIGTKSFTDYSAYANDHIYNIQIPNCDTAGRVFVGQRQEGFAVNLGPAFDLVNLNPLGDPAAISNPIGDTNITTLALEIPTACLAANSDGVVGGWTTASLRQARILNPRPSSELGRKPAISGGPWVQVSRLGMPLVNELVIGLKDKDRFNSSEPKDDGQFATYVTNPTFPALLEILFAGTAVAPKLYPRTDLVAAFLTGVGGLNQQTKVTASEMLRLNTKIAPIDATAQSNLGVLGGDTAGFPNGRRPGDDVVDSVLRVAMGALISDATIAPNNTAPLNDGVTVHATDFSEQFPYLNTPLPGSANL